MAGVCSVAFGVAVSDPQVAREVFSLVPSGMGNEVWLFVTPMNFLLIGSLLLAAGLGASGARRMRR